MGKLGVRRLGWVQIGSACYGTIELQLLEYPCHSKWFGATSAKLMARKDISWIKLCSGAKFESQKITKFRTGGSSVIGCGLKLGCQHTSIWRHSPTGLLQVLISLMGKCFCSAERKKKKRVRGHISRDR